MNDLLYEASRIITAVNRMEALGRAGVTVSVVCGPSGGRFAWSVDVLGARIGQVFQQPFAAKDFAHAIEIADQEIARRGWLNG
jgi:hypothetical protein